MPETHILYGGLVTLEYDDDKHVYMRDGVVVPNVTSITGIKDKPFLMPWGLKVMGLHILENWPNEPSTKVQREALIKAAKRVPRITKETAADYGKQAHSWVEGHIKAQLALGDSPPLPEVPQVLSAVNAFLAWERQARVHFVASEKKIYSLAHNYSGTLDIMATVDGVDTLLDIKTSNSYRDDYALQTAAYVMAWNEEYATSINERIVLMLHKETAAFEVVTLPARRYARDCAGFVAARGLYQWAEDEKTWR